MAFDPSRLLVQLQNTGLANKDNPLFQLLFQMIRALTDLFTLVNSLTGGGGGGGGGSVIINNTTIQQMIPPPSRNDMIGGSRTLIMGIPTGAISQSGEVVDHVVLSDGVVAGPTPVNDGAGNFVYIPYVP